MGNINSVTCRNCGYHAETKAGPGFVLFRRQMKIEEGLLNGEINNPEALQYLKDGGSIASVAAYLCPCCKEFLTDDSVYFLVESPSKRTKEAVFPFGAPKCPVCNAELVYIPNIRSSKVRCPKCGGVLKAKLAALYD